MPNREGRMSTRAAPLQNMRPLGARGANHGGDY
jgi:hypothetical protein